MRNTAVAVNDGLRYILISSNNKFALARFIKPVFLDMFKTVTTRNTKYHYTWYGICIKLTFHHFDCTKYSMDAFTGKEQNRANVVPMVCQLKWESSGFFSASDDIFFTSWSILCRHLYPIVSIFVYPICNAVFLIFYLTIKLEHQYRGTLSVISCPDLSGVFWEHKTECVWE